MQEDFDKTFDNHNSLEKGDYEACRFTNCDFSNTKLSESRFIDCRFSTCNLSLAQLTKTVLQDVVFENCKLLGLRFDQCGGFGLSLRFVNCIVNHSSFYGSKMKGTIFSKTELQEVDFSDADLTGAMFQNCNLINAHFENTTLLKADFRTSYNYSIDPETNSLKGAQFSLHGLPGLLDKYGILIDNG